MTQEKHTYEIRQVDAWNDGLSWIYNNSFPVCTFSSAAIYRARLFTRILRQHGITFKKNRTRIEYDGDIYEIVDRKTGEPLFCMIPET